MLNVTGTTQVAAVIGDPVEHSLSPVIHNAAFAHLGLDWVYLAMTVASGRGGEATAAMRTLGLRGLSVTMPHKTAVLPGVDEVSDAAEALQAANCLAWSGHRVVAHNTDGDGFVASLRADSGVEPEGLVAVVVGAGGAARSVVRALAEAGAAEVIVVNRTLERAEHAVSLAGAVGRVGRSDDVADADLVVNATSVGMGTPVDDREHLPVDPALLGPSQTVVDLVYQPVRTALLARAEEAGARPVDGVGMLVHQAAIAFGLWTGEAPPVDIMTAAARAAIANTDDA